MLLRLGIVKFLDMLRNFIQTAEIQSRIDGRMTETDWPEKYLEGSEPYSYAHQELI